MPAPPTFVPINIPSAIQTGIDFDTQAYGLSDQEFSDRFGTNLVPGRQFSVEDAVRGIEGQESPVLTNALSGAGFGDINFGKTKAQQSKNLGREDILSMDKRGREYFQQTLGLNPRRGIGPSGKNVADMAMANTGGRNNFNVANYSSSINNYNQQVARQIQNQQAYTSAANSALGLIGKFAQPSVSPYLNVQGYGAPNAYAMNYSAPSGYMGATAASNLGYGGYR